MECFQIWQLSLFLYKVEGQKIELEEMDKEIVQLLERYF